jgi:hypothetical protein
MFCQKCGKELDDGASFCASCGASAGGKRKWPYIAAIVLLALGCVVLWGKNRTVIVVDRGATGDAPRVIVVENGSAAPDGDAAVKAAAEVTTILRDLRNLKSASLLFYGDKDAWPKPGDEKLLDGYSDRPIVGANPPRYQKITISGVIKGASGEERQYIGVTLFPDKNGTPGVKHKLAEKAEDVGFINALPGAGEAAAWYTDSDTVWFSLR